MEIKHKFLFVFLLCVALGFTAVKVFAATPEAYEAALIRHCGEVPKLNFSEEFYKTHDVILHGEDGTSGGACLVICDKGKCFLYLHNTTEHGGNDTDIKLHADSGIYYYYYRDKKLPVIGDNNYKDIMKTHSGKEYYVHTYVNKYPYCIYRMTNILIYEELGAGLNDPSRKKGMDWIDYWIKNPDAGYVGDNLGSGGSDGQISLPSSSVKFLLPPPGFVDIAQRFTFTVAYNVPHSGKVSDLKIEFEGGGCSDFNVQLNDGKKVGNNAVGTLKFDCAVSIGKHALKCTINGVSSKVLFERLEGVVDKDGDGVDDRCGQPVDGAFSKAKEDTSETGFLDSIKNFFKQFNGVKSSFGEFNSFMRTVFNFLPAPFPQLLFSALAFAIIWFFVKIVRG